MTTTDETPGRLLSLGDLAGRWQVSTRTIMRITERGELHFLRVGKKIRFKLADVLAYEKKRRS